MTDYKKQFIKCLESVDYSRNTYDVFRDFVELSALSVANSFLRSEEIEKEYMDLVSHYKNPNKFAELLGLLVLELERNPYQDLLGHLYMSLDLGNKHTGQFFTPFHVSEMMAAVSLDPQDIKKHIETTGYITVSEPCIGAGGMIIAAAKVLTDLGYNPQQTMWFQGVDIDRKCFNMSFLQTSLLGLSGELIWGDTLRLQAWRTYNTPISYTDVWQLRFMAERLSKKIPALVESCSTPIEKEQHKESEQQESVEITKSSIKSEFNITFDKRVRKSHEQGQISLFG